MSVSDTTHHDIGFRGSVSAEELRERVRAAIMAEIPEPAPAPAPLLPQVFRRVSNELFFRQHGIKVKTIVLGKRE